MYRKAPVVRLLQYASRALSYQSNKVYMKAFRKIVQFQLEQRLSHHFRVFSSSIEIKYTKIYLIKLHLFN